ncbi:MAG TPA: hypothetical protein ENI64_05885 [Gammaproteobacteria bacterium]|nr:hypothetical protein [Gammaproteobacteria bacterium]
MQKILLLSLLALILSSCSSVKTNKASVSLASINESESFQVLVRTGSPLMDKLVYEIVFLNFSDVLPLKEKEPFSGVMEITFVSTDQSTFVGSSNTVGNATAYGSGWYSGNGYAGGSATISGSSTTLSSGGSITWQNSTMLIVLKKANGERLWVADYNYKGGWEMSGWSVNTPDEAARLVVARLREKFQEDFNK